MTSIALRGLHKPAPEAVPGASLHSEALSPECGREHWGTGVGLTNSTCRSRAWGTIGADCSRVARATTPGPLPQPHGWVRLEFEVSRFPDFCEGGAWHVLSYLEVWSLGLFSPTFNPTSPHSQKKRGQG